jgi:hypothetical protein
MSTFAANVSLVEDVRAHIHKMWIELAELGIEPRFDISYEGFGTGCTTDVTVDDALRYLTDLAGRDDPHYRHRARIKSITISVRTRDKVFSS